MRKPMIANANTSNNAIPTNSGFGRFLAVVSVVAVLLSAPGVVLAQWAQWDDRVLISLNASAHTTERTITDTFDFGNAPQLPVAPPFELGSVATRYGVPKPAFFDASVVVRLSGSFGLGLAVDVRRDTTDLGVVASVAHPLTIHPYREVSGTVPARYEETAIHLQLAYVVPLADKLNVAVTAGPTIFSVNVPVVRSVALNEAPPFDTVTFRDVTVEGTDGNGWGFHAGADVSWMFNRNLGLGGMVRYSYGTVEVSPAGRDTMDTDVGGLQLGAGVRVAF
jgi:hypothetical protein